MARKQCPMKTYPNDAVCIKEECAWFEGGPHGCCAILMISIALRVQTRWSGAE